MPNKDAKTAKSAAKQSFPDVERAPGHLSQWDTETFAHAGLTPLTVLRDRFGHDYTTLVGDAATLRTRMKDSEWQVILAKAERGGRYKLAKMLTEHGGKGDIAADFGAHRDTLSREEKLYDNLPWAYPQIMEEANKASSEGKDYLYNIDHIITLGKDAARSAGATKTAKPKYAGDGKVIMIDPTTGTVEMAELPPGFPGGKTAMPRWEEDKEHELQTGALLFKEVGGNKIGYYTFDLPLRIPDKQVILPCHGRVILLRVNKGKELLNISLSADALTSRIDFGAREPRKVDVLSIDPVTGKVERTLMLDNEIVQARDDKVLTALTEPFDGLTLMQIDVGSIFAFTIAGLRYKGRSFVLRLEPDSYWIAPLASPLSVADVTRSITFNTLQAAVRESGEELTTDPNAGWEGLTLSRARDYLGLEEKTISDLRDRLQDILRWKLNNTSAHEAEFVHADYLRRDAAGVTLWNIDKLRTACAELDAAFSEARAEGFRETDPTEMGAENYAEISRLAGLALDLRTQDGLLVALKERGYLRIVANKGLYHVERMTGLLEQGRAALSASMAAAVADGFGEETADNVRTIVGTENASRMDLLRLLATALNEPAHWYAVEERLKKLDCVRIIGQKRLWHLAQTRKLVAMAETGQTLEEPPDETADADPEQLAPDTEADDSPSGDNTTDSETVEDEFDHSDYPATNNGNQSSTASKLLSEIVENIDRLEERAIGWSENSNLRSRMPLLSDVEFEEAIDGILSDAGNIITELADRARAAKTLLTRLTHDIEVQAVKSGEPADVEEAIKRDAIRARPHLSVDDILACYVQTPAGVISIFGQSEDTPADENEAVKRDLVRVAPDLSAADIDILALYVRTLKAEPASEIALEAIQPSGRRGRKRHQQPPA